MESTPLLKIIIGRHGPKLSAAGEKNVLAPYFHESVVEGFQKMNILEGEGLVHVATSSVKRSVDTANIFNQELEKTDHRTKGHVIRKKSLEAPFQPIGEAQDESFAKDLETITQMQQALEPDIRRMVEAEYPDLYGEAKEAEIRNVIDTKVLIEMFHDDEILDPKRKKFNMSFKKVADHFAKRYVGFLEHLHLLQTMKEKSEQQPRGEPYIQIDVSHSFPIMSFLKKYFVFEDGQKSDQMTPEDFFGKIGGVIRESGSFQMEYLVVGGKLNIKVEGEFSPGKKFSGMIDPEHLNQQLKSEGV